MGPGLSAVGGGGGGVRKPFLMGLGLSAVGGGMCESKQKASETTDNVRQKENL